MLLSIIIPIYNGEKFIKDCLLRILPYISDKCELIIVNDGSTDATTNILQQLKKNNNISIYNNSNMGVSYSRNFGIKKSHGKWIIFLDVDDLLSDNWYDIIRKYLNFEADVLFFSSNSNIVDLNNIEKDKIYDYILGVNKNNYFLSTPWSKIYSRKFLVDNKIFFDSNIVNGEDMLFNISVIKKCQNYKFFNESFYMYKINSSSVTHKYNSNLLLSDQNFHKVLYNVLDGSISNNSLVIKKNYCIKNALFLLINNSFYLKKYDLFIKSVKEINLYPLYNSVSINNIFNFRDLVILLYKKKLFFMIYILLKIRSLKKSKAMDTYIKV